VPALKLGNKIYKQNKVPQRAVCAQARELAETHFSCFLLREAGNEIIPFLQQKCRCVCFRLPAEGMVFAGKLCLVAFAGCGEF